MATMTGVVLPGSRRLEYREFPAPEPGHGQVLVRPPSWGCRAKTRPAFIHMLKQE
jgi:hypothetical protein